jgi:hypothetical protein
LIFNFIIQFKFIVYYYFQFGPHSFNFFPFLFKLFLISIYPPIKKFVLLSDLFFIFIFNLIL